jgi:YggT family protein
MSIRLVVCWLLFLYSLILIATVIVSWVSVMSPRFPPAYGPGRKAVDFLHAVTEPVVRPVRRVVPPVGAGGMAIDLSFLIVMIAVFVLQFSIC